MLFAGYTVRDSEAQGGGQPVHCHPGKGGGGRGREPLSGEEADPDEGGREPAGNFTYFESIVDLENNERARSSILQSQSLRRRYLARARGTGPRR